MLKISGDDEIEGSDLENLARQGRIAVERSEEDEYVLFPGISFDTSVEVVDFYRENLQEYVSNEDLAVYGNSEELREAVADRDTWASFRSREEQREWAVDASNTVKKFSRDIRVDPYERAVDGLSAATLYIVARAESDGEVGTGMYDFHHGLVRYLRGQQKEYSEEGVLQDLEDEIEQVESELEKYQREKGRVELELEEVETELEQVEQEIGETDTEIELYRGMIDALYSVRDLEEELETLYERIEDAEDISDIEQYIRILQNNVETLDSRLQDVEYGERRLHEIENRINFLEQENEFQNVYIQVEDEEFIDTESRLEDLEEQNESAQENIVDVGEDVEDVKEELMGFEDRMEQVERELERGHGLTWVWRGTKRWYGRRKQNVRNLLGTEDKKDSEE